MTIYEKIQQVNKILENGQPDNVSVDPTTSYTGYKPQHTVDAMNEVFDIGGWGFSELENNLLNKDESGKPTMAIAKVEVFIKGIETKPVAYGQANVIRSAFGDAQKSAQTDAIKKALSYFSVGSKAFRGELVGDNQPKRELPTVEYVPAIMCPKCGSRVVKKLKKDGKPYWKCEKSNFINGKETGCDYVDWTAGARKPMDKRTVDEDPPPPQDELF